MKRFLLKSKLYARKIGLAIDYEKLVDLDPDNQIIYRLGGTQAAFSEVVVS